MNTEPVQQSDHLQRMPELASELQALGGGVTEAESRPPSFLLFLRAPSFEAILITALTKIRKILPLILPLLGGRVAVFFSLGVEEAVAMAAESVKCEKEGREQKAERKKNPVEKQRRSRASVLMGPKKLRQRKEPGNGMGKGG